MLRSNSGGSCALLLPPISLPPTSPSSAARIQLFVQPCSEMIQEGGKGGRGDGKAKLNPNLTPLSELLPLPQREKTRWVTKPKSRSEGNLLNHSAGELQPLLLMPVSAEELPPPSASCQKPGEGRRLQAALALGALRCCSGLINS